MYNASVQGVDPEAGRYVAELATLDVDSRPTLVQATRIAADIYSRIQTEAARLGWTVPVTVEAGSLAEDDLRSIEALGVSSLLYRVMTARTSDQAIFSDWLWTEFQQGLARFLSMTATVAVEQGVTSAIPAAGVTGPRSKATEAETAPTGFTVPPQTGPREYRR